MDTVAAELLEAGLGSVVRSRRFRSRLLTLYYEANADEDYAVPGMSALRDGIVEPLFASALPNRHV